MKKILVFIHIMLGLTVTMAQSAARIVNNNVYSHPWSVGNNFLWVDTANQNYITVAQADSVKKYMREGIQDSFNARYTKSQSDSRYLTSAPVTSVNGQTGAVVLSIPSTTGLQSYSDTSNWDATKYWVGQQAYITAAALTPYATITQLNTKFNTPTGTTSQYLRGDGSLATFPTIPIQYNPTQGTGIIISGSYPNQTITNSAPDQTVTISQGSGINVTGTYPSFTIASTATAPSFNNAPARTLNSSYQISTTRNTRVSYTVSIVTALSLLNLNSSGIAYLEISANNSTWVTVNSAGITRAISIAISLGLNETSQYNLQCEVPSGYWARIRTVTTGGATVSFTSGQETQY